MHLNGGNNLLICPFPGVPGPHLAGPDLRGGANWAVAQGPPQKTLLPKEA